MESIRRDPTGEFGLTTKIRSDLSDRVCNAGGMKIRNTMFSVLGFTSKYPEQNASPRERSYCERKTEGLVCRTLIFLNNTKI